jgi:hypothetical protein
LFSTKIPLVKTVEPGTNAGEDELANVPRRRLFVGPRRPFVEAAPNVTES